MSTPLFVHPLIFCPLLSGPARPFLRNFTPFFVHLSNLRLLAFWHNVSVSVFCHTISDWLSVEIWRILESRSAAYAIKIVALGCVRSASKLVITFLLVDFKRRKKKEKLFRWRRGDGYKQCFNKQWSLGDFEKEGREKSTEAPLYYACLLIL